MHEFVPNYKLSESGYVVWFSLLYQAKKKES